MAEFHARGVKVFLPTMPWDNGTRDGDAPDWERMADLVAATGADGINGDTYSGVPARISDRLRSARAAGVLQPESTAHAGDHHLSVEPAKLDQARSEREHPDGDQAEMAGAGHIINIENRWSRDRTNDLQHVFFNGIGYVAWENVFGFVNQFTPLAMPRPCAASRRYSAASRR